MQSAGFTVYINQYAFSACHESGRIQVGGGHVEEVVLQNVQDGGETHFQRVLRTVQNLTSQQFEQADFYGKMP